MNKLEDFLNKNNITPNNWDASGATLEEFLKIESDFNARKADFDSTAESLAKTLQNCNYVHSIKWRVKKTSHLINKIIRKK